ncbi:hypothetical protein B0T20DRAFT_402946 [Sordaria brevicollis]|uniref:Uncharacterized protein n=1 Tax=Sordaria brevicollis TaxID=83679 RepID=A0AAE0PL47_SORBR|nr:hypothetical protein B0T20DRAFT_402946 [Sordaria brevicollis]
MTTNKNAIVAILICLIAFIAALIFFHKKIVTFLALWMADAKNAEAAVKESKSAKSTEPDLEAAKSESSAARSGPRSGTGSNNSVDDDRCDTVSSASSGPILNVRLAH